VSNWDAIVRTHGPMVFGTAWRILGHAADSEDVVQDVFLEAHRLQEERVRNWGGLLRRLATYRALDRLRQRKHTCSLEQELRVGPEEEPEAAAIGRELAQRLRQAITQLPEREGTVFCLRYFEDLSYQQIASTLDISAGAVAQALHKARAKLETLLIGQKQGSGIGD
jgi:RNA polymerase sigma-70 factor (ECF subfamily)